MGVGVVGLRGSVFLGGCGGWGGGGVGWVVGGWGGGREREKGKLSCPVCDHS